MIRRYIAEALGTFAIVFFGCGAIATLASSDPASHLAINAVFGLTVGTAIYALGNISAAHFNPAVTIGFASAGRFPWRFVPQYIASQFAGGLLGSGLHALLLSDRARGIAFGSTLPIIEPLRTVGVEIVLTFFLMLVIFSVATDKRVNEAIPGLAIGSTVALCGLFGGPLTGCSMNPARSLAPALLAGGRPLALIWIYMIGPVIGALLAVRIYESIRGSDEHAQGAPNDLLVALRKTESAAQ